MAKEQYISAIGQMFTGMQDKAEGTALSLINFIKDYHAAKRLQLGQENVGARRTLRARGQRFRDIPVMPDDAEVSRRVLMDLVPFGRELFGRNNVQGRGVRQSTQSQPVNYPG